jgi:hypothetical protein
MDTTQTHFTRVNGPDLVAFGDKMARKRNPVYVAKCLKAFTVETPEGILSGQAGDYLACDPISGHVWPVAASYAAQHYEPF